MRWEEIAKVVIRERQKGWQESRRPDRLVIISGATGKPIGLNTSILSFQDESLLLAELRHRVTCPIITIQDE